MRKLKQLKTRWNKTKLNMISALSSGNASKYEFLAGKDILPEKDMLEKGAGIKRLGYFLLGKELKAQSDITKKQHQ